MFVFHVFLSWMQALLYKKFLIIINQIINKLNISMQKLGRADQES